MVEGVLSKVEQMRGSTKTPGMMPVERVIGLRVEAGHDCCPPCRRDPLGTSSPHIPCPTRLQHHRVGRKEAARHLPAWLQRRCARPRLWPLGVRVVAVQVLW